MLKGALCFPLMMQQKAEKNHVNMVSDKGIDKMIDFFNTLKMMISSEKKIFICSENYKMTYDERGNKRMTDVYSYIRENYFKPVPLSKVARIAKMNPIAFSRFFKKNSGAGFVEYLNKVRTNKACYLLRETEYQVQDIARECGFSSISNFNKQFRKAEGISPTGLPSSVHIVSHNIFPYFWFLIKYLWYGNDIAGKNNFFTFRFRTS